MRKECCTTTGIEHCRTSILDVHNEITDIVSRMICNNAVIIDFERQKCARAIGQKVKGTMVCEKNAEPLSVSSIVDLIVLKGLATPRLCNEL